MSESKTPNGIDRLVGQRLRWRRRELKLTQEKIGEMLDLTFQQVQKYEKGANRISAGRLFEMANVLNVPVSYFYDGAEEFLPHRGLGVSEDDGPLKAPVLSSDALELVAAFQRVADSRLRKSLLSTVRAAAEAFEDESD